jgi:hypothetical protein
MTDIKTAGTLWDLLTQVNREAEAGYEKLRGRIKELEDELERLRASLPRTADGAIVLPGQQVYYGERVDEGTLDGSLLRTYIKSCCVLVLPHDLAGYYFSTPELAEAEATKVGGPEVVHVWQQDESQSRK